MPKKSDIEVRYGPHSEEYQLNQKIIDAIREAWGRALEDSGADPVMYSRISVLALLQIAAVVAVDCTMQKPNFVALCDHLFDEAFTKAPRFH
jgi:hypothetical protein